MGILVAFLMVSGTCRKPIFEKVINFNRIRVFLGVAVNKAVTSSLTYAQIRTRRIGLGIQIPFLEEIRSSVFI
jgi:hypothetical protein